MQNFLPKPGTAMRAAPPCPPEEHLRAIALARLILPFDVHLQAPPNLTDTDGSARCSARASTTGAGSPR